MLIMPHQNEDQEGHPNADAVVVAAVNALAAFITAGTQQQQQQQQQGGGLLKGPFAKRIRGLQDMIRDAKWELAQYTTMLACSGMTSEWRESVLASQTRLEADIAKYRMQLHKAEINRKHKIQRAIDNKRKRFMNHQNGNLRAMKRQRTASPELQSVPEPQLQQNDQKVKQEEQELKQEEQGVKQEE